MSETCKTCWFAHNATEYDAQCRRFPPQIVIIHMNRNPDRPWPNCDHDSQFPVVAVGSWCGEHKAPDHD